MIRHLCDKIRKVLLRGSKPNRFTKTCAVSPHVLGIHALAWSPWRKISFFFSHRSLLLMWPSEGRSQSWRPAICGRRRSSGTLRTAHQGGAWMFKEFRRFTCFCCAAPEGRRSLEHTHGADRPQYHKLDTIQVP